MRRVLDKIFGKNPERSEFDVAKQQFSEWQVDIAMERKKYVPVEQTKESTGVC